MRWIISFLSVAALATAADLRIGIIGTDTSHAVAFTKTLNATPGVRVVAAYKGGSPDVEASRTRVEKFATELSTTHGVELVPDIPTLTSKVDAILLLSVDGRVHLEQAKQAFAAKKPVFIDKPFASTLADARAIAKLGEQTGTPFFSSSSFRFGNFAASMKVPDAQGVMAWGPGPTEEHHELDLSWYGIHTVELLFTIMGRGCEKASMVSTKDSDVVTGIWKDGRIGTARLARPYSDYGAIVFRPKQALQSDPKLAQVGYEPMLVKIVEFFRSGKPPVDIAETLEIFEFMDAAQRSKKSGGAPVSLR